jgi:hypothetical protein
VYIRAQRARRRGLEPVPEFSVTAGEKPQVTPNDDQAPVDRDQRVPGPAERATTLELESLPASQSHLALGQAALAMSRILDDHRLATTQPSAARQLSSLMLTLRRASAAPRGRLAVISKMVERPDAG